MKFKNVYIFIPHRKMTVIKTLCIPIVKSEITEKTIRDRFDALNMGTLEKIDMVPRDKHHLVFVHYKSWNETENSKKARELLIANKDIKIIYDDEAGWFWKVSMYRDRPPINKKRK